MKIRFPALVLILFASACEAPPPTALGHEGPSTPDHQAVLAAAAPASRHVLVATAAELQALGEAVDDMRSRVLPTLAEVPESKAVGDVLDRLSAALERRDAAAVMQAASEIGAVRGSLDLEGEWAAEFDVLSLLVDAAQRHVVVETVEQPGRAAVGGER
jgi:hypothetical protein